METAIRSHGNTICGRASHPSARALSSFSKPSDPARLDVARMQGKVPPVASALNLEDNTMRVELV